jgi:SAM-dependent methyltransferase
MTVASPESAARIADWSPDYWEGVFAKPDPWNHGSDYEERKAAQTLSLLPAGPIERALEIGCAEGHFTAQLAPPVGHLTACDISATALARARERCAKAKNIELTRLDLLTDDLPRALDLILCSEVLYYVAPDLLPVVAARIAGALCPGGHLLLAHARQVSDERGDFGHPFGAKAIGKAFAGLDRLHLVRQIETPLYLIQLFSAKGSNGEAPGPPELVELPLESVLTPAVEKCVVWGVLS